MRLWGRKAIFAIVPRPNANGVTSEAADPGLQFETGPTSGLRIAFDITRTLAIEPNQARIEVYNLSSESRARVEQSDHVYCTLRAGYVETEPALLFQGDIRRVPRTERRGPDLVTVFEVGDAELDFKQARISLSWSPGAVFKDVFRSMVQNINQGTRKALSRLAEGDIQGAAERFARGWAASGRTFDELDRLVRSKGLELSVQDDELQLLAAGELTSPGDPVVLTPESGLLGEPSVDPVTGIVSCASLLLPEIRPARLIEVRCQRLEGQYRAERCRYIGDTRGRQWLTEIEGSPRA